MMASKNQQLVPLKKATNNNRDLKEKEIEQPVKNQQLVPLKKATNNNRDLKEKKIEQPVKNQQLVPFKKATNNRRDNEMEDRLDRQIEYAAEAVSEHMGAKSISDKRRTFYDDGKVVESSFKVNNHYASASVRVIRKRDQ